MSRIRYLNLLPCVKDTLPQIIYSFYSYVLCKWQYIEEILTTIICGGSVENIHMVSELSRTSLH